MNHFVRGFSVFLIFSLALISSVSAHASSSGQDIPEFQKAPPTVNAEVPVPEEMCQNEKASHRRAKTVFGVEIEKSLQCDPDNPKVVAAVTKGTNNVPMSALMKTGLNRDAVRKGKDLDGDGDPDVINITMEVSEINGRDPSGNTAGITQEIAPGIKLGFWVFSPKTRGMATEGSSASDIVRAPSPTIRIEKGDRVRLTLENTHYLPHSIHLHGIDHKYMVNGSGNDGVPQTSGKPVMPGGSKTYEFTPGQAGTMFYHCHVQPNTHVLMGLQGMFVINKQSANNTVQTFNIGGGKVRHPSNSVDKKFNQSYDLIYQGVDKELHNKIKIANDPRVIARAVNKEYDVTEREPDYFLLNGKSFPYTMRESQIIVEPNETTKMRVLNAGSESISIHTHGHKPTATHYDGVKVNEVAKVQRDVFSISAAQRVDLTLNTTIDGLNSYGKGVWFFHNHKEEAVTTDGIAPGGDVTTITYESYLGDENFPEKNGVSWKPYFTEKYYKGEIPMWQGLSEKYGLIKERPASQATIALMGLSGLVIGALGTMVMI